MSAHDDSDDDSVPHYQRKRKIPADDGGFMPDPVSGSPTDEHDLTKAIREFARPIIERLDGEDVKAQIIAHDFILGRKNAGDAGFYGLHLGTHGYAAAHATVSAVVGRELNRWRRRKDTGKEERRYAVPDGAGKKTRRQFDEMSRENVVTALKGYHARITGNQQALDTLLAQWNQSGKGDPITREEWVPQERSGEESADAS